MYRQFLFVGFFGMANNWITDVVRTKIVPVALDSLLNILLYLRYIFYNLVHWYDLYEYFKCFFLLFMLRLRIPFGVSSWGLFSTNVSAQRYSTILDCWDAALYILCVTCLK